VSRQVSVTLEHGPVWTATLKIGFRFTFCYFTLYSFLGGNGSPLGLLPGIGRRLDDWLQQPMDLFARWIGIHLIHLAGRPFALHAQATGDGALRWVAVAVMLVFAALSTVVWSVLDRRRLQYVRLLGWFRLMLRLVLGLALLKYGFIKVFPIQFGPPPLAILNEPVGNSSALTLFWTIYGLNPAFVMVLGWTEVIAGLLLIFRKTAFIGALLCLAAVSNVALLDLSYDVPVKLYSLSLVAMTLVLLAPECSIFKKLFWTREPITFSDTWGPLPSGMRGTRAMVTFEVLFAVLGCWQLATGTWNVWHLKAASLRNPPSITGEWRVDGGLSDIESANGSPIVTLFFDPSSDAMLKSADGTLWRTRAIYDQDHQRLRLLYALSGMLLFSVEQPDLNHLILAPQGPTALKVSTLKMTRVPLPKTYPLLHHDFHWVNDYEPLR
jgi:hypothetical protein